MMNTKRLGIAFLAICALVGMAAAQEKRGSLLTQAELQNLFRPGAFQDFTVAASGSRGSVAFVPDGSAHMLLLTKDGRLVQDSGTWRIADGTFCIQWKVSREGKENCLHYYKVQDNQYESWFAADGKAGGRYTMR